MVFRVNINEEKSIHYHFLVFFDILVQTEIFVLQKMFDCAVAIEIVIYTLQLLRHILIWRYTTIIIQIQKCKTD